MTQKRSLLVWLASICFLIVLMVVVGGVTRLTHSGLSMVEWNPIMGAIPPLTEEAWLKVFHQYQQFPEYKLLNQGMALSEFKSIFFWEYFHRLIGRMMGVVFLFPGLFFWIKGWLDRRLVGRLLLGFSLGGLQGALGWFMVKSGLVDHPHVSHYRLAAHLILALAVLAYFYRIFLEVRGEVGGGGTSRVASSTFSRGLGFLAGLLVLQIIYGAFTAGLRAGFGYNTFPKMNDEWFPTGFLRLEPAFLNPLENPIAVQFIHRSIGWAFFLTTVGFWFLARRMVLDSRQRFGVNLLLGMTGIQFLLGVATLLWVVPVSLASLHQFGACVLLLIVIYLNHVRQGPERHIS